jgi:hypothetical protein
MMGATTGIAWTDVPTHPGYQVTNRGEIKGPSGRVLCPMKTRDGYLFVLTPLPRRPRKLFVHRAVLLAFCGPCPEGYEARHLSGDKSNNATENLAWGTRIEQRKDDRKNGVSRVGRFKLSPDDVITIRALKGQKTSRNVGKMFSVSHTSILEIWGGARWATVQQ